MNSVSLPMFQIELRANARDVGYALMIVARHAKVVNESAFGQLGLAPHEAGCLDMTTSGNTYYQLINYRLQVLSLRDTVSARSDICREQPSVRA